jgi:putative Ca2+/H+ antiporter (TMEM165/GDT1 family)
VNKVKSKLSKSEASKHVSSLEVLRAAVVLTFLAEWGDRSQITTIALATEETFVVLVGALLGHFVCTSTAVLGGKMISSKISEKYVILSVIFKIRLCGGVLFVLFGLHNMRMLF